MGKFNSVTHSIFNQLGKMENNLVKMMFEVYFPYFLLLSILHSIKSKGNIDWLRELTKIVVNQRKNRNEMASNRSICACPMTFLSHLLIAGCDIGVQISVRPYVRSFVRPSVNIYVEV